MAQRTHQPATPRDATPIDDAFEAFVRRYEAGQDVDLAGLTAALADQERRSLLERLDGYLASAPRRPFNREAYEASRGARNRRQP
jgi:hypothetical protein